MSEIGLDAVRNERRCAGKKSRLANPAPRSRLAARGRSFSWTDGWFRGGAEVDDWAFGLTDRARRPKPALSAVELSIREDPPSIRTSRDRSCPSPFVSYNGARTIRECLEGLRRLEYPNYEVIVVNDGSTDATAASAGEYDVRLINTDQTV